MNKYLKKLGYKKSDYMFNMPLDHSDKRCKKWKKEKKKYSFDSRETWSLNTSAAQWLYCHLKMFVDETQKPIRLRTVDEDLFVDFTASKFDIPVLRELKEKEWTYDDVTNFLPEKVTEEVMERKTQEECIALMIEYLEEYLKSKDLTYDDIKHDFTRECIAEQKAQCAFKIFSIVFPKMWW